MAINLTERVADNTSSMRAMSDTSEGALSAHSSPFISGQELYAAISRGDRLTILDSHWAKTENSAWEAYVGQHIPGAMFCNPLTDLAAVPSRAYGRNPMPAIDILQRKITNWGIKKGRPVVIYDAGRNIYAARAWWVLRWAGVENVKILNGGTSQWEAAGGDVAGGIGALRGRGNHKVMPRSMPELYINEIDEWKRDFQLIDCRGEQRYRGIKEPYDHQGGHIPGAINIPNAELLDSDGLVDTPERVRAVLAGHGVTDATTVAAYSGSGLHSALFIAAMEHAGIGVGRHFVGGWSQWSASSSRKIARG